MSEQEDTDPFTEDSLSEEDPLVPPKGENTTNEESNGTNAASTTSSSSTTNNERPIRRVRWPNQQRNSSEPLRTIHVIPPKENTTTYIYNSKKGGSRSLKAKHMRTKKQKKKHQTTRKKSRKHRR